MLDISKYPYIGFDTETTGLHYPRDRAFGFSIAAPDGQVSYHDIRREPKALDHLIELVKHWNGRIITHNASFDYRMFKAAGGELPLHLLDDTVIRATLINEHERSYELDRLGEKYLGMRKESDIWQELADIFGGLPTKNVQIRNLPIAPVEVVAKYCNQDALLTLRLWEWQEEEIERQGIQDIVDFERSLIPTFCRTETRGIRVDLDYAEQAMEELTPIIEQEQEKLNAVAGRDINVNSTPQIREIFSPTYKEGVGWIANDGTVVGTTKKGQPSISAEYLREMSHPAAPLILSIRSLIKTRDTFLAKHVLEHAINGRVYPNINQSKSEFGGTGTGRLSYTDPAMQQIPSRNKKVAAIVKPCFLPEDGCRWVDADMASFEVRVFAHLINNPQVIAAYKENPEIDFHQFVSDITGLVRNAEYSGQPNAKQLNLSMIFNSGDGAIAAKMGMPWTWETFTTRTGEEVTYRKPGPEAKKVIELYHRRLPGVRELAEKCKMKAESRGYLFTYRGRRLRFPNKRLSYKASGILIQATAADRNKEHWKLIETALGDSGFLTLNTHDSYSMSIEKGREQEVFKKVKRVVEETNPFRVPLILELSGIGRNWWEAVRGS